MNRNPVNPNMTILFICSSADFSNVNNISNLQYAGRVLNLARELKDEEITSFNGEFIVVNATSDTEMRQLRLINLDNCVKVAVIRKHESAKAPWLNQNFKYDYIIKQNQTEILKSAKSKLELLNHLKFLDLCRKKPATQFRFWLDKARVFLPFLLLFLEKKS